MVFVYTYMCKKKKLDFQIKILFIKLSNDIQNCKRREGNFYSIDWSEDIQEIILVIKSKLFVADWNPLYLLY